MLGINNIEINKDFIKDIRDYYLLNKDIQSKKALISERDYKGMEYILNNLEKTKVYFAKDFLRDVKSFYNKVEGINN